MADKKRISETTALRLAEQIVARSMPSGWSAKVVPAPGRSTGSRNVSLRIRTTDGDAREFGIVTKRPLNPMEAGQLLDIMGLGATTSLGGPKPIDVALIAPYLSERTREVIAGRGVSYIDSTGNAAAVEQAGAVLNRPVFCIRSGWVLGLDVGSGFERSRAPRTRLAGCRPARCVAAVG